MLTFNLKKVWYDKICNGEKTHEYRIKNEYWQKRIDKFLKNFMQGCAPMICLACAYPRKDDKGKRMYAKVKGIYVVNGKNTDLKVDTDVYDIHFELVFS